MIGVEDQRLEKWTILSDRVAQRGSSGSFDAKSRVNGRHPAGPFSWLEAKRRNYVTAAKLLRQLFAYACPTCFVYTTNTQLLQPPAVLHLLFATF
jgi:hypothetical protein